MQQNRQRRPGPELGPFRVLREVALQEGAALENLELGSKIDASLFVAGESVDIVGTSKGKGFQGGVKRHGFRGGPKTHVHCPCDLPYECPSAHVQGWSQIQSSQAHVCDLTDHES